MSFADEIAEATELSNEEKARLEATKDDARSKTFEGTFTTHLKRPLIMLWNDLHENQLTWMRIPEGPLQLEDRSSFDDADKRILKELAKTSHEDWTRLCHGIGWTLTGCVALTWCSDVDDAELWDCWRQIADQFTASDDVIRACQLSLMNSLTDFSTLTDLTKMTSGDQFVMSVLLACRNRPVAIDLAPDLLGSAGPQLASFLIRFADSNGTHSNNAHQGIAIWKDIVKGTKYEIRNS